MSGRHAGGHAAASSADGRPGTAPSGPNLCLICVDCLREDLLASDRTDTPFLDDLRSRGVDYRNLHATATTTTPAVASLLTGTYAERNGVESLRRARLNDGVDTLASILSRAGYRTTAAVTGPLVADTGLDRGFDDYRYREPDASAFGAWRDRLRGRLGSLPEPFAAFVHLWELHEDVHVPPAFDAPEYGETPYERALSALDRALADVTEVLPENTVLAVTGDHGESITHRSNPARLALKALRDGLKYYGGVDTGPVVRRLNRALDGHGPNVRDHFIENNHGENVFDFVTNVPFVLAGPGIEPDAVDAQCRQVDVLPTLLDALAVPFDGALDGESLLPADEVTDRPAYLRACGASLHRERNWARAVRVDGAKLVTFPDRDWDARLYDLDSDPRELAPVDDDALEARLRRHLPAERLGGGEELAIDERLRALGYR